MVEGVNYMLRNNMYFNEKYIAQSQREMHPKLKSIIRFDFTADSRRLTTGKLIYTFSFSAVRLHNISINSSHIKRVITKHTHKIRI